MTIIDLPDELRDAAVALWRDCGLTRPWNDPDADLNRALGAGNSTVLAAIDTSGRLQGTVMVGHDGHRGWVYYLAVDPSARRQGLGRALMAAAESWVHARGVPTRQLMVRGTNTAVVDFYTSLGYADQHCVVLGKFFDQSGDRPPHDLESIRAQLRTAAEASETLGTIPHSGDGWAAHVEQTRSSSQGP